MNPFAVALMSAGAVLKFGSLWSQGTYYERQGQFNKQVADNNAIALENEALSTQNDAALEEKRHRQNVGRLVGEQRVAFAKGGVTATGTPDDVETDTMIQGELDAMLIKYNGERRAQALRYQAASERVKGQISETMGKYAKKQSRLAAFGTLLGAGGDIYTGMGSKGGGGGGMTGDFPSLGSSGTAVA